MAGVETRKGRGRLRNAFEYVLFFVKSEAFIYNIDAIRDPLELEEWWVKWPERYNPQGKVPTNVWEAPIPVQGSWANRAIQHACPLPPDLVEKMILVSTHPGDVVLDPFAGTGVVVAEAERLGRRGLGVELVRQYVSAYRKIVRPEILARSDPDIATRREEQARWLQDEIMKLRVTKYPKVLMKGLVTERPDLPMPFLGVVLLETENGGLLREQHKWIGARLIFASDADQEVREEIRRTLKEIAQRPPGSKFGIAGDVQVVDPYDLPWQVGPADLFLYSNGQTWMTDGPVAVETLSDLAASARRYRIPPILANVEVREIPHRIRALTEAP